MLTASDRTMTGGLLRKWRQRATPSVRDTGGSRALVEELRALEHKQDRLREEIVAAGVPEVLPALHPNVAQNYRQEVERLEEALHDPAVSAAAVEALRSLIDKKSCTCAVAAGRNPGWPGAGLCNCPTLAGPRAPLVAIDEDGLDDMIRERSDQRFSFPGLHALDASAIVTHHIQALAPGIGMRPDNRMPHRRKALPLG